MKRIQCDGKEHVLLEVEEYNNLTKDVVTLNKIPVQINIPMPRVTCGNWDSWKGENSGVIYKGTPVLYKQLENIKRLILDKDEMVGSIVSLSIQFDGKHVNVQEISKILMEIDELWDKHASRLCRKNEEPLIIHYFKQQ